ncbi:MAG: hypothetical protein WC451_00790 [Patescibacteria group bacterium]
MLIDSTRLVSGRNNHLRESNKAWVSLRSGCRHSGNDWSLVCQIFNLNWYVSTEDHASRVRDELIKLANDDPSRAKKYGQREDEVLFSLAWLNELEESGIAAIRAAYHGP